MLRTASVTLAVLNVIVISIAQAVNPTHSNPEATGLLFTHIQRSVGMMEALACVLVIAFVFVYVKGLRFNDDLANAWFKTVRPILDLQFAKVGAYHGICDYCLSDITCCLLP